MRRFATIFLLAFLPPTVVMTLFALRSTGPSVADGGHPVISTATGGLPPRGVTEARGVGILVYEGGRLLTEIRGGEANFQGRERGVIQDARIVAWPEPGMHAQQPAMVEVTADEAEVDREGHQAVARGNVRVTTSDGDRLIADELKITLGRAYVDAAGEKKVDRSQREIETAGPVTLERGESRIRGIGFHGNLGLRKFRFDKDVEGSFFGPRGVFLAEGPAEETAGPPEDLEFRAGGPVVFEPRESTPEISRSRLSMGGGVWIRRIDAKTERPATLTCRDLLIDLTRPTPPAGSHPPGTAAKTEFERFTATGDVDIRDAEFSTTADAVTTDFRPDGSLSSLIKGPTKKIVLRGGAGLPLAGGRKPPETAGGGEPVEITAVDDIRIERAATAADGTPGNLTFALSRWVWVRQGAAELTADRLDLTVAQTKAPGATAASYAPRTLHAAGNVALRQEGRSARAETLVWNAEAGEITLADPAGAEVEDGATRLRARTIVFNDAAGTLHALDAVRLQGEGGGFAPASLLSTSDTASPGSGAWTMTCHALTAALKDGEITEARAEGDVSVVTDDSATEADLIVLAGTRVHLTGAPVRITSGQDLAAADDVVIDTDRGTACLRAVREIRIRIKGGIEGMVGLPSGPATETERPLLLTCRGPVYVDQTRGTFSGRDGVTLRAVDGQGRLSRLDAERLSLRLDPATRQLSSALATGRVLLRSGDLRAAGDRLTYDVATRTAHFTGRGHPIFAQGAQTMRCEELVIADGGQTIKFLARRSKGSISFPDRTPSDARPEDLMKDPFHGTDSPRKDKR
ncbi:MAG: LPS export ABC transporter periplasmic protein LptC [Candidatus Brocadiae bacterium]|nr:LPS export ABC transporter periplasmic protein LptC [Candidatus Brocadiia bacterium]